MLKHPVFFSRITSSLGNLRARLGDLWWYTALLFVAQRVSDVINAAVGLWLVPKYVSMDELGAVLPLTNVGTMLALPLSLISLPFLKFLNQYMRQGTYGKAKKLLRDTLFFSAGLLILLLVLSPIMLPAVFERMRIENGRLGVLIMTTGVVTALSPMFLTIMQAQKLFRAMALFSLIMAALRMATMCVCLPIRGLSGYFVGQIVPNLFFFGAVLLISRQTFGKTVRCEPYLSESWRAIARYSAAPILYALSATFATTVHAFVIRRCLPDVDSAAYYMLMRFAEIALTIGTTCALILFPLAADETTTDAKRSRLLLQALAVPLAGGIAFTAAITPMVWMLFRHVPDWLCYLPYMPHLAVLCLAGAINGAIHCYFTFQCARGVFNFIPLFCILLVIEGVFLYCLTGYTFFTPWIPEPWMNLLAAWNPCRLSVVIGISTLFYLIMFAYVLVDTFRLKTRRAPSSTPLRDDRGTTPSSGN